MAKKTIIVQDTEITLLPKLGEDDYISLTDIDQKFEGNGRHIENWLRNQNTVEYLATWETLYNPNFNSMQLHGIKEQVGINRFLLSAKKWIETTNAIGIRSSSGRYGGTFAHPDIAFHFCLWLSPTFQLYISKEFQRLKQQEAKDNKEHLDWTIKRTLAKINYKIHADAIKTHLIPFKVQDTKFESLYYASEADLLNIALFSMTAKEWRESNPDLKGNMRDYATAEQLLVLANLENLNAEFIKMGFLKENRLTKLNDVAIYQMHLLVALPNMNLLKSDDDIKNIDS
jgi:KilA-N domain